MPNIRDAFSFSMVYVPDTKMDETIRILQTGLRMVLVNILCKYLCNRLYAPLRMRDLPYNHNSCLICTSNSEQKILSIEHECVGTHASRHLSGCCCCLVDFWLSIANVGIRHDRRLRVDVSICIILQLTLKSKLRKPQ